MCSYRQAENLVLLNPFSPPAGVLQGRDFVQAGGAAGRADKEEHLYVPGCMQGIPG